MARPSTPLLSVDKIAGAAIALVDATGELTMTRLAQALCVRPSSLYNHVAGRDDLVEAMRTVVFSEMPVDVDPALAPNEALPVILRAYREAFARHPRLIPMLTAHTVAAPDVLRLYSTLATLLARSGIPDEHLLDALTILDCFVIGAALDVAAPDEVWAVGDAASHELRTAVERSPRGRVRADQSFELGLAVVLGGLDALRS